MEPDRRQFCDARQLVGDDVFNALDKCCIIEIADNSGVAEIAFHRDKVTMLVGSCRQS